MPFSRLPLALLALLAADSACAIRLPVLARYTSGLRSLSRRATPSIGNVTIVDSQNVEYISQITVGGANFNVLLDTGSSDLNVRGTVPEAQDTTTPITVQFAEGSETGVASFATVTFAGYSVESQIFNHVPINNSTTDDGLLGLGPSSGSVLHAAAQGSNLASNAGDSLLDRVFQQNTSTPNYMTFLLSRDDTTGGSAVGTGEFTIGELLPGYENLSSQPQLPVLTDTDASGQHWTIILNGVTGSDGKGIVLPTSVVAGTPSGQLVTVLDSGFTFPQVPSAIAAGFYSQVSGAQLTNIGGLGEVYTLPCNTGINASFSFAGVTIPIHPLDLNFDLTPLGLSGTCVGAFQPIQDDAVQALAGEADMILGMAFLRNTYTLMNFGDFVDATADARKTPFVQLLPITDPATATAEFITARNGGDNGSGSTSTSNTILTLVKKYMAIIIAVPVALILLGIIIFCCVRRRRRARAYRPLQAPAPAAGYNPYGHQSQAGGYQDPFRDTSGPRPEYAMPLVERPQSGQYH